MPDYVHDHRFLADFDGECAFLHSVRYPQDTRCERPDEDHAPEAARLRALGERVAPRMELGDD